MQLEPTTKPTQDVFRHEPSLDPNPTRMTREEAENLAESVIYESEGDSLERMGAMIERYVKRNGIYDE